MTQRDLVVVNVLVTIIPLSFALVYPYIGTILAFTGSFAGFIIIYCLPVMVHLKKRYTQITNPLLAEAIALNEFRVVTTKQETRNQNSPGNGAQFVNVYASQDLPSSPKIMISDRLVGN